MLLKVSARLVGRDKGGVIHSSQRKAETDEMSGRQEPDPAEGNMAKGAGRGGILSLFLVLVRTVEDLMRVLSISTSPGYQLLRFYGNFPSRGILEVLLRDYEE